MVTAVSALALLATATIQAASSTWTGTGTNSSWATNANWVGGTVPASGDDIIVADATLTNNITMNDGSHTIGLLQFGTAGTRANPAQGQFIINDNVTGSSGAYILTITNGVVANGNFQVGGTAGFQTKLPITVQGDQTWSVGGNPGDPVTDYGLMLTVGANGAQRSLVLNGTLTKIGPGQLCFVGQNVGNGNIVVNQGSLKMNAGSSTTVSVGGTGSMTINSGAAIFISRNSGTLNITKAIVLNDGSFLRFGGNNAGQNYFGSPLIFNGTVGITMHYASMWLDHTNNWSGTLNSTITGSGGTITLWGDNSGLSGTLNNNGTFRLKFGSANSSSAGVEYCLNNAAAYYEATNTPTLTFGALSGSAGTVRNSYTNAGVTATLTVGALNTSRTFGGVLADNTGPLAMMKVGTGALTLTGANTLSGGINVVDGAVIVSGASASAGGGNVTVQNGAAFGGSGNANGAISVMNGGTIRADGGAGSPPLNVGSLTLGSTATDLTTSSINLYSGGKIANIGTLMVNGTNVVNIVGAAPRWACMILLPTPVASAALVSLASSSPPSPSA
jgi:autotransporter-associated beta strand protein